MLVANGLTGTMSAITLVSVAIAVLMTVAALLLLRDVGRLERRLLVAAGPSQPPADSRRREEAIEAKTRFLATVSHEIRTPLNGVLGMAELLAGTRIDAEQHSYVSAIKTSGEALLALIDEILDFSKIEVGKLDLVTEEVEIGALVEGVAELLAPRAQGKGIEIAASVAGDLPARIIGDGGRLRQVLINLAGNAVKFTEAGGVGITVARNDDRLEIRVSDTGVGIPADRQAAIFEDFEQADGSSSRRFGGTGLGLAISRRIIEGMGGSIAVRSSPGDGACFTVMLPLVSPETAAVAVPPGESVAGRYLLVSAGPFQAPFLADALQARGGTATVVKDMATALALLRRGHSFDAVMVDGALGHDEARAVARAAESLGVARRIVMLSPYERRAFGAPAAGGFNGYLVKPIRTGSLIARLTVAPGDPSPESGEAESAAGSAAQRLHRPGLRVLVAEDNDINAILATRLLERHGCEPTRVADGLAALAAFEKAASAGRPYDVILMDIRMPGLDGLEAARRIRDIESRSGAAATRIVALTANAFPADRAACFAAGFSAFVSKPLAQASLLAALGGSAPPPAETPRLARKA